MKVGTVVTMSLSFAAGVALVISTTVGISPSEAFVAPSSSLSSASFITSSRSSSPKPTSSRSSSSSSSSSSSLYGSAPKRLDGNVDGPLFVNDKCINCAACAMFAPSSFQRHPTKLEHNVYHQPTTDTEIEQARAALSACPVSAIRVETSAFRNHNNLPKMTDGDIQLTKELALSTKLNGRPLPFPRPLVVPSSSGKGNGNGNGNGKDNENGNDVWFVGHHNEASFGAAPYLFYSHEEDKWIMVDTPKFSKSAVLAVESLTDGRPVDCLILTHVDDTAGHNDWKNHYPNLQRIFHAGDLGRHNWVGDTTLEHVEVLLQTNNGGDSGSGDSDGASSEDDDKAHRTLPAFDLYGNKLTNDQASQKEVVIYHTPGHSPGSISTLFRRKNDTIDGATDDDSGGGVLFTGDTYAYRLFSGQMTGFPRYGNNRVEQARVLPAFLDLDWTVVAPGHGHYRDYSNIPNKEERKKVQRQEMQAAIDELVEYGALLRR